MCTKKHFVVFALTLMFFFIGSIGKAQDSDASKGQLLLKAMSKKLSAAKSFSFSTTESNDVVKLNGEKAKIRVTRDVLVRRPNGFWTKYAGDRDWQIWYDGKRLTGISPEKKVYIQHDMPPTLDETMDMLAMRFNLDLPMSDLLYSSPYDAFMDAKTQGGFVGKEPINGASCSHLSYTGAFVDWQLWIDEKTSLPCRLEMTYKRSDRPQFFQITFSNWNFSPKIRDDAFTYKIPEGYARIPMLERVKVRRGASPQTQTQTSEHP